MAARKVKVSAEGLLNAGAHFGHQRRRWNPKMAPYIHGEQDGIHVFDLMKTKEKLEEALEALTKAVKEGKKILILGTKKQAREKVKEVAQKAGVYFVAERWLGGTLTNFEQIIKSTKKLSEMKKTREAGEYKEFTKKERVLIDREIERLERFFGGIEGIEEIPDLMVVVDIKREHVAVKEARQEGVITVGITDTNADPEQVDFPIPMNDDAVKALTYVLELIKEAILLGQSETKPKK